MKYKSVERFVWTVVAIYVAVYAALAVAIKPPESTAPPSSPAPDR